MRKNKEDRNNQIVIKQIRMLNRRIFRKNKGRNLVAVLAIIMTTMMFTTLFTLALSMQKNLIDMTFRQIGYDAQVSMKEISPEQAELLAGHPKVQEVGESIVLGLAENDRLAGRQVEIRWANDSYASHSYALPTTGRMPQSADEVALDTLVLDRLGIPHELGQQVTLEWKKNWDSVDEEPLQAVFTLCGFWEGNASIYASMAWVDRTYADDMTGGAYNQGTVLGTYMAQICLKDDNRIEADVQEILSDTGLDDLEYSVNLAYSPEMGATAIQETLPMYLGMILVFIAGYLIIYNIFQISVTADIQFYGKLKTLGTTTRQLKRLIFGQSNRLCLIAIPLGLVLGWIVGVALVPVFTGIVEGGGAASANPLIFVGSAVFAWITVTVSCLRPARLAGKVSPMEALRMGDADCAGGKKLRKSRHGASLPGMAWANLGRSKKRTVTVICSMSLGFVLLSCFYAKDAAFDIEKYLEDLTIADFTLSDATDENYMGGYDPKGTTLNAKLVEQMESADGVEQTGHLYSHQFLWQMDDQTVENMNAFYTKDVLDDWASYDPGGVDALHQALERREANAVVYGLDGIPLDAITQDQYVLDGAFDASAFDDGRYVLAVGPAVDAGQQYDILPAPSVGSTVVLEGKEYTVMAVVYPIAPVDDGASENGISDGIELHFIVPGAEFCKNWPDNTLRRLFVNVKDDAIDATQEWLDTYTKMEDTSLPVTSRKSMAKQYETETRSAAVMGNAISIVIALVGVLNFINSMVTAILSRRREFAMIQSIGMTKRQLRGMLICEGLYYAGCTLVVSYLVSALAVGIGIRNMVEGGFTSFHFTLLPLNICSPVLLLFAILLPYLCFRNLEKQSIVERLRAVD